MINYVFVYCTESYPLGICANNTKISLLSEAFVSNGDKVTIINDPYHVRSYSCKQNVIVNKIPVITIKDENILNLNNILNKTYDGDVINVVVLEYMNFVRLWSIMRTARKVGYKIAVLYQEWHWELENTLKGKINVFFNDFILQRKADYIFPISNFLMNKSSRVNKSQCKLPIISKFDDLTICKPNKPPYFAYCASIAYLNVIKFILNSFDMMNNKNATLNLVINGNVEEIKDLYGYIRKMSSFSRIKLYSKLPYSELKDIYKGATALLIPLVPNYKPDIARFSQKIAEYLETGHPIISTSVGEVEYYFKNEENIFITEYKEEKMAELMDFILLNPAKASKIGNNGRLFGREKFKSTIVARNISNFIMGKELKGL